MNEKRPVSIEDLLRLKRAERPAPEFWNEFDRQLRAKQLAALVAKRPWWHGLRASFSRVGRYQIPLGATAVLAVTFLSLRQGETPSTEPVSVPARAGVMAAQAIEPAALPAESEAVTSTASAYIAEAEVVTPSSVSPEPQPASLVSEAIAMHPSREISQFTAATAPAPEATLSPSARFIAANLAAAQESIAPALLADTAGFESRLVASRPAAIEPLEHMSVSSEPRRSARFLTAMVSSNFEENSARTTERVASRISPEELYDQVRRFGTRRGGLNVKF